MLEDAVTECPDTLWDAAESANRFWLVAYHGLFYTHLYLQFSLKAFKPWAKHRERYQDMGHVAAPPDGVEIIPYTKAEVLEYLAFCRAEVDARVPELDLEQASGFEWLPFDKLELQIYTIRHLQHHTGELAERLGRCGVEVNWVGMDRSAGE
jgi:hypothetical protein